MWRVASERMWQEVSPMRSKRRRMFSPVRAAVAAPGGILIAVCMFTVVVPRVATVAAQSAQEGLSPQEQKRARPLVVGTGSKTFREGLIPSPIPPLPGKNAGTVDGVIVNAPFWMTDPRSVHEGVFSDGLDLADPPQLGRTDATCPGSDPSCGWVNANTGVAHASSPDFGTVLQQAIDDVKGRELPKLDGGFLTEGFDILKTLAGYADDLTQIGSPNDGAEAFMIPFLLGTRITPLSLLHPLPEIRVPVAMVTGESEVLTPTGTPFNETTYQTVTHGDAILSSEVTGSAGMEKLLATVGPVQIFAHFGLTFGVGQLFSDESVTYPPPPAIAPNPPGMPPK